MGEQAESKEERFTMMVERMGERMPTRTRELWDGDYVEDQMTVTVTPREETR